MLTTVEEQYPSASQCGKCHVDIYNEWKHSAHSTSFSNKAFRYATNEYAFQDCLGCHAPVSIHGPSAPIERDSLLDEGVTCVACHLIEGKLTGPIDTSAAIVPHKVGVEKDFFKSSALCGACHQGTFAEWERANAENKKNCQDCHMPEVTRKVTQATGMTSKVLVGMEEERKLKRHTFDLAKEEGPNDTVSLDVRWPSGDKNSSVAVILVNRAPHLIPTGDFGFRKGVLILDARTRSGKAVARETYEFYKETGGALKPLEQQTFEFSLAAEVTQVEVTLLRKSQDETRRIIIAQRTFVRPETSR